MNKELSTTGLLSAARKFQKMAESGLKGLALLLPVIEEKELYKEAGYDSFKDYYSQDLKISKGWASKLLTVGKYALESGFQEETLGEASISTMYAAISAYGETKEPQYVLAAAQTQTLSEIAEGSRDKFGAHKADWEPAFRCKKCGKYTISQQNHD